MTSSVNENKVVIYKICGIYSFSSGLVSQRDSSSTFYLYPGYLSNTSGKVIRFMLVINVLLHVYLSLWGLKSSKQIFVELVGQLSEVLNDILRLFLLQSFCFLSSLPPSLPSFLSLFLLLSFFFFFSCR